MMTTPNLTLYRLLVRNGATEAEAAEASQVDTSELVTKADLKLGLAELKADLSRTILTTLVAVTAIYAGIVGLIMGLAQWGGAR